RHAAPILTQQTHLRHLILTGRSGDDGRRFRSGLHVRRPVRENHARAHQQCDPAQETTWSAHIHTANITSGIAVHTRADHYPCRGNPYPADGGTALPGGERMRGCGATGTMNARWSSGGFTTTFSITIRSVVPSAAEALSMAEGILSPSNVL